MNIRPYAVECLKEANKYFEVIVFTAGTKNYADAILDVLDPNGDLIHHRLYRDSCIRVEADGANLYIKDLRILENRDLKDIVIVDNAVISFAYQIDNGIPILPFKEDKEDIEFIHLMKFMKDIANEDDCRNFVRKWYKISEIMKTNMESYVHHYEISDSDSDIDDENYLDMLVEAQKSLSASMKRKSESVRSKKLKKKKVSLKKCKKHRSHMAGEQDDLYMKRASTLIYSEKNIFVPHFDHSEIDNF